MKEEKPAGWPLRARLATHIHTLELTTSEAAQLLGISQSYLSQLLKGDKSFSKADDAIVRAVSTYLGLPGVIGFVLAGKLQHSDFVEPSVPLAAVFEKALNEIVQSPPALEAAVDLGLLQTLPEQVKLLLVLLYQEATGVELLVHTRRWSWME